MDETLIEILCACASAGMLGLSLRAYLQHRSNARLLRNAPIVTLDALLYERLAAEPGKRLPYAMVRGKVRACGAAICSQMAPNTQGVIQRLTMKEHYMSWSWCLKEWAYYKTLVYKHFSEVPFALTAASSDEGSDGPCVVVCDASLASGLRLSTVHRRFIQTAITMSRTVMSYMCGRVPFGYVETEKMLRVGASLAGAGEILLDEHGVIRIRAPRNGAAYFLSQSGLSGLRKIQERYARTYGFVLAVSATCVTVSIIMVLRRAYLYASSRSALAAQRRAEQEFYRQLPDPSESGSDADAEALDDSMGAEVEEAAWFREPTCAICMVRPCDSIFLNCGHACCCRQCYYALQRKHCPVCQARIARTVPLYLS